ncbi:MAG: hypothetical protein J0L89_09590, partial [Xanthomonadales bacterium]|nr:hypothetical protein [Xanthomonadales bacterium]
MPRGRSAGAQDLQACAQPLQQARIGRHTALQYFSFALARMPYMGVGRNLAFSKQIFERTGGFEAHRHI